MKLMSTGKYFLKKHLLETCSFE